MFVNEQTRRAGIVTGWSSSVQVIARSRSERRAAEIDRLLLEAIPLQRYDRLSALVVILQDGAVGPSVASLLS